MSRTVIPLAGTGVLAAALPLLIDSTLKGAALLLITGLLSLGLRQASAATRHLTWLIALGALVVLPLLSAMLPGWRVLPVWTTLPLREDSAPLTVATVTPRPDVAVAAKAEAEVPIPAIADPAESSASAAPLNLDDGLGVLWAAGVTLLVLRLIVARLSLSGSVRRCQPITGGRLWEAKEAALSELRVSQPVRVLLDSGRTIPMVWGLFRPTVMLPSEACDWTDAQIRSVFLHELAHIKRRDLASQFLVQIACALHWFNPLVWIAAWRLRVEAEHACDNLVLSKGVRASDYAEHVLHVATKLVPVHGGGTVALAMARPSRLEGRMMAVLSKGLNRRGVTRVLAMTAVLFGLFVIVPMAMLRAADEKKPAPTKAADVAPADAPKVEQKTPADGLADQPEAGPTTLDVAVDGSLTLDGASVTLKSLPEELSARKANNPNLQLEVHIPSNVPFNRVASVLDVVEKAGGVTVTLRTPEKKGVSRIPEVRSVPDAADADRVQEKRSKAAAERDKAKRESDLARMEDERARVDTVRADVARLKLRQAEAQLRRMEQLSADNLISNSELDQARLEVGRWKAESVVDAKEKLKADLELAEAELALNQANYKRMAELFDKNLVAQSEMEMAKAERAIAQAKLRAAKVKLDSDVANAYGRASPVANPAKKERLLKILDDEIQVAAAQAKLVREQHSQGRANIESVFRADFEVMTLQRERASMMGDPAAVKDLIAQQIGVLQELEKATREQRREGVESESEALKVRRQILMLQRQQAEMDF